MGTHIGTSWGAHLPATRIHGPSLSTGQIVPSLKTSALLAISVYIWGLVYLIKKRKENKQTHTVAAAG